jgi:hypothetical protein
MGWGRMLFLGNIGQQLDLDDVGIEIQRIKETFAQVSEVDHAQGNELQRLRRDNDELRLYVVTLMRLLVQKGVLTTQETASMAAAIDTDNQSKQ